MIIPGSIKKTSEIDGLGIMEPGASKIQGAGAVVARVVIDLDKTNPDCIPVRVFNPTLSKHISWNSDPRVVACQRVTKSGTELDIIKQLQ